MKNNFRFLCLFLGVASSSLLLADTYEECILKNMKGADKYAINDIRTACEINSTPKKCRGFLKEKINPSSVNLTTDDLFKGDPIVIKLKRQASEQIKKNATYKLNKCLEECENAGFISKNIGECSH